MQSRAQAGMGRRKGWEWTQLGGIGLGTYTTTPPSKSGAKGAASGIRQSENALFYKRTGIPRSRMRSLACCTVNSP
jgi:hypothetical protein